MFDTVIENRRSVRSFLLKPVEPEKIEKIVEAAIRAPASMCRNPWEFIVVTEPGLLEQLSRSKNFGSGLLKGASVGIVICADPEKSDVWIEDASIASLYILLAAEDQGLGSCWVQIRKRDHDETTPSQKYVSQVLQIPDQLQVLSIVGIGYSETKPPPHKKEELQYNKVHLNCYDKPYSSDGLMMP